jgi:hypothetical protein
MTTGAIAMLQSLNPFEFLYRLILILLRLLTPGYGNLVL